MTTARTLRAQAQARQVRRRERLQSAGGRQVATHLGADAARALDRLSAAHGGVRQAIEHALINASAKPSRRPKSI